MEWEDKTKMIVLGNKNENSEQEKKAFQDYVLEKLADFDGQAWDMFCNLITLDVDQMKTDIEFWRKVYEKIKGVDCNDEKFGFRSGMRIAMIQTICEEELKLNI